MCSGANQRPGLPERNLVIKRDGVLLGRFAHAQKQRHQVSTGIRAMRYRKPASTTAIRPRTQRRPSTEPEAGCKRRPLRPLLVITVSTSRALHLSRSSRAFSSGPERPRTVPDAQGGPTGGPMGGPFTPGPMFNTTFTSAARERAASGCAHRCSWGNAKRVPLIDGSMAAGRCRPPTDGARQSRTCH
jgi:hypothetical protein